MDLPHGIKQPRILLLQVRGHADAEAQEQECFSNACGVGEGELATYNLVPRPAIAWPDVQDADVLILGGAGDHTARLDYPFSKYLDDVVTRWIEDDRPFFGSCYGHHYLARLLGGKIELDPDSEEVGSYQVSLTEAGAADPLFSKLPSTFWAQLGHHDRVASAPPELIELASSARCRFQALRLDGKPVYGTQFHPEMDAKRMQQRLEMYCDSYIPTELGVDGLERRLRPTPEAGTLLTRFLAWASPQAT